jgi:nitrous oxide reductase accessory protein NosL
MKTLLTLPAAAAALAACATIPAAEAPPAQQANACPASTANWRAWVNAMPGPNARPTLIVIGDATVPTGGYRMSLTLGATMRSEPAQQIVHLNVTPPDGMATQAIVTSEVRGDFPGLPRYGAVTIVCNGEQVGRISPVETAS